MGSVRSPREFDMRGGCFWSAIGGALALLLLILFIAIAGFNRISGMNERQEVELTVLPYYTSTPSVSLDRPTPTETGVPAGTPDPGEIVYFSIGELVEIYGTEGDGLRLRNSPGLDATINVLALENEVFEVRGGPQEADGYVWWFLINPYDNTVQGWSVGNFLRSLGS
jgi:hypothetical protein